MSSQFLHVMYQHEQISNEADILRAVTPIPDTRTPSTAPQVIGLGENSVDRVFIVPQLPGASMKMRVNAPQRSCGGQVATCMAACSALGLRAAYVGAVGNDEDGRWVRQTLQDRGVDVTNLHTIDGATSRWATILVDASTGERAVLWDRDAALSLTADHIGTINLTGVSLVHVDDTDIASSIRLALAGRRAGLLVTTDIDAACDARDAMALLKLATHPVLSEHAVTALSGETDPASGLRALRRSCDGMLCVTLGARGAMALEKDTLVIVDAVPVTAIDTTGAGDVFRAALITALLDQRSLPDALKFANAAAALSCTKPGAIGGVPTRSELLAFMSRT